MAVGGHLGFSKIWFLNRNSCSRPTGEATCENRSEITIFLFAYILRWRAAAILDFQFGYSQGNMVMGMLTGTHIPNLVKFWLTVQKLLTKLFSIGFACKVHKNWGFGQFRGQNFEINISHPKRHFLSPKHAFWRIICPNRSTMVTCGYFQETKQKETKNAHWSM